MVNKAKTNGGFIDQKMFKTAGKYCFDSLFLTDTSMQVLDGYINHIRPLLKPTCDYILVTRNGGQQNKLGLGRTNEQISFRCNWQVRSPDSLSTNSSNCKLKKHLSSSAQSTISRTRNTALSWQEFTIKNNDRAKSLQKRTNFWKDCTATRNRS